MGQDMSDGACPNPFQIEAPLYGQVRPAYPRQVIDWIVSQARSEGENEPAMCGQEEQDARALRIADIGAGTGKMSILLAEAGAQVWAVEPSENMAAQMPRHEGIASVRATAEETSLPDASCQAIVFAQSWHWVDPVAAGRESARIAQPGASLNLVWNQMDVSIAWVHRLSRIMRSGDVHRESRPPFVGELWTEPRLARFDWVDRVTPEELLDLGTTRSSYLRQDEAGRRRMQDNLRWYLYEHLNFAQAQPLNLPYMTLLWRSRLLESESRA